MAARAQSQTAMAARAQSQTAKAAYYLPGLPGFIRLPGTSDCQGCLETQKVLCAPEVPRQSTVDSKENFAPPS